MEKKIYMAPSISYVSPDTNECRETNAPMIAALSTNTTAIVSAAVTGITLTASTVW